MKKMVIDYVALEERGWKIGFFLLPIVGLALIGWGGYREWRAGQYRNWLRVDGVVLESKVEEVAQGGTTRYAPRIQYRYFMDDKKNESGKLQPEAEPAPFDSRIPADEIVSARAVGANVKVWVNPENTAESFLLDPPGGGGMARIIIGGGLLILFILTEIHHHTRHDEPDTDLHLEDTPAPG